jgi:hypothetical protein
MALSPQRWKALAIVAQGAVGAGLGVAIAEFDKDLEGLLEVVAGLFKLAQFLGDRCQAQKDFTDSTKGE